MATVHVIGMDTHGKTTNICCKTSTQAKGRWWHVATTIPALREVIESIRRPRRLTFEEGPLADWLHRELQGCVDEILVCDPRRNALIAKDGDKDDPIDAGKLCDLYRGGYLRAVHHSGDLSRTVFKRLVGLYHERVEHRVSEANKIIGWLKCWGMVVGESSFSAKAHREKLVEELVKRESVETAANTAQAQRVGKKAMAMMADNLLLLWHGYDCALAQETQLRRELERAAKKDEAVVRLAELPGIAWVRAATLVAYLDTPFRFASKSALWKYMGIGLVLERSGEGRGWVHVELACNRRLKSVILGAAQSAIMGENPFAAQHQAWVKGGISGSNAKRNVARSLATTAWGMWKSGSVYDPNRVGVSGWQ